MSTFERQTAHSQNLKEIERLSEDIQKELAETIQKTIIDDDIEFTGGLRESVVKSEEGEFKTVEVQSPYARIVEWGLLPGIRPNFDALRNWVQNKLGITDEDELNTATMKISNKILNKGIEPKLFVRKSIRKLISKRGYKRVAQPKKKTGILGKLTKVLRKINKYTTKMNRVRKGKL